LPNGEGKAVAGQALIQLTLPLYRGMFHLFTNIRQTVKLPMPNLFYSNEHEPVHVHGKYQDMEGKAEFIISEGKIVEIRYTSVRGRKPLDSK
jgi:hypothetical protein